MNTHTRTGMRDYAPYLATSSALGLWAAMGPARVRAYMRDLLAAAVELCGGRCGSVCVCVCVCSAVHLCVAIS